jgi:hypothetical protein
VVATDSGLDRWWRPFCDLDGMGRKGTAILVTLLVADLVLMQIYLPA